MLKANKLIRQQERRNKQDRRARDIAGLPETFVPDRASRKTVRFSYNRYLRNVRNERGV